MEIKRAHVRQNGDAEAVRGLRRRLRRVGAGHSIAVWSKLGMR
jgi:hypothetical protein